MTAPSDNYGKRLLLQPSLPMPELALGERVKAAIKLLREHGEAGYDGCFSGGKDSCVIKALAAMADVEAKWTYNVTTIDPPELVRFIRAEHGDVAWWSRHGRGFFREMRQRGIPSRRIRWCCSVFKERRLSCDRPAIMGIRAAESPRRRATWQIATIHTSSKQFVINPILAWTERDVWEFIGAHGIAYCGLYDEGFRRLGCVGCPMARPKLRHREFERWPKLRDAWRRTFGLLWDEGRYCQYWHDRFESAQELWEWWLSDESVPPRQCGTEDLLRFQQ